MPEPVSTPESIVLTVGPSTTLPLGTALVVCDDPNEKKAIRMASKAVIDRFYKLLVSVPACSKEGIYLSKILAATVRMASGIQRRRATRRIMEELAERQRKQQSGRYIHTEWWKAGVRIAIRMLLLAGFGYFFAEAFFPGMKSMANVEGSSASVTTALAVTFIGLCLRSAGISLFLNKVMNQYTEAMRTAKEEYLEAARKEYRWAAEASVTAWKEFTGRDPDILSESITELIIAEATSEAGRQQENTGRKKPSWLREIIDFFISLRSPEGRGKPRAG